MSDPTETHTIAVMEHLKRLMDSDIDSDKLIHFVVATLAMESVKAHGLVEGLERMSSAISSGVTAAMMEERK